jgi:hypothetical protein
VAYLSHPTCLALLFVALLGFLMLQFQIIALNAIKDHARANANSTVAATSSSLAAKMNAMAADTSADYARDFNAAIARHQQRIDDELFGKWINTTAITLNETVGEFYDGLESGTSLLLFVGVTLMYSIEHDFWRYDPIQPNEHFPLLYPRLQSRQSPSSSQLVINPRPSHPSHSPNQHPNAIRRIHGGNGNTHSCRRRRNIRYR